MNYDYEICTHMAYIFVGSYKKFEVDGSVRYRYIAINVKWGHKLPPPRPQQLKLSFCKFMVAIYQSWDMGIMGIMFVIT